MKKTVTHNDLLRYVYQETGEKENARIEEAIAGNFKLKEEYQSLLEIKSLLGKPRYNPSQDCIAAILNYSRQHLHEESSCG